MGVAQFNLSPIDEFWGGVGFWCCLKSVFVLFLKGLKGLCFGVLFVFLCMVVCGFVFNLFLINDNRSVHYSISFIFNE